MRLFLLRSLNSCSDLLNSPPFKALPLFEKPHVRAAPSRFAHSAPKQGHRASRAFANPTIGFALGNYSRAIPLAARTSSAGGMPTTQNAHLLWWFARYFCSTAPLGGEITLAEKLIAMRHAMPNALHRTFDSAAVDGGFHQNASHGRPQVDPRPCPQLRVEIPRHAITVVTGVSGSGKSSLVLDTIAAQYRREHNGIFPSFTQRYLPN